jgi:lysophospholipase L1-like esterase
MKLRLVNLMFLFLLIISLSLNGILLYALKKYYTDFRLATTFPSHESFYQPANLALPEKKQQRIVLFGDSRIQQWKNLPAIEGVEFINRGIGGETTAQLRARLVTDVLQLNPDIVVLQMGINDLVTLGIASDSHVKAIIEQCHDNLHFIIDTLTKQSIKVILLTIIPPTKPNLIRFLVWSDLIAKEVEAINKNWLLLPPSTRLNQPLHVIDTAKVLQDEQGQWHKNVNKDTLHLTPAGYEYLNQALITVLKNL